MSDLARLDLAPMTREEFFAWAPRQHIPYELVDGAPVPLHWEEDADGSIRAMAAARADHGRLMTSLGSILVRHAPAGCEGLAGGPALTTSRGVRQPDLMLACGPWERDQAEASNPVLLVEILSPSTGDVDRGQKLVEYQEIASVREIWFVDSTRRHVAVYSRDGEVWINRNVIGQGSFPSSVLTERVPLDEIYARVPV